jgi:hypothetical protein
MEPKETAGKLKKIAGKPKRVAKNAKKVEREPKSVIKLIAGQPPEDPETRKKYYQWVISTHVPDLIKYKGIKGAVNYTLIPETDPEFMTKAHYPERITIFEFYSKEDKEAYDASPELAAAIKDGLSTFPAAIGYTKVWNATYIETDRWQR